MRTVMRNRCAFVCMLLLTRMSETSGSPFRIVEHFYRFPTYLVVGGDHHLADTFPVIYSERFGREVDQYNPDFATIVRIDRPRCIQQGDAMF